MNTKMKVVFPGDKYPVTKTTYIAESDVEFYVDLKSSDVNSVAAKCKLQKNLASYHLTSTISLSFSMLSGLGS